MSKLSVSCIAQSRSQAKRIVDHLKAATLSPNCISVLYREAAANPGVAGDPTSQTSADDAASAGASGAPERLANIGTLSFPIPGVGTLFACGPIIGAMRDANPAVDGGGIVVGLREIGIAEREASQYDTKISSGSVLISVGTDNANAIDIARSIFMSTGATDISRTGEASQPNEFAGDQSALFELVGYRAAV